MCSTRGQQPHPRCGIGTKREHPPHRFRIVFGRCLAMIGHAHCPGYRVRLCWWHQLTIDTYRTWRSRWDDQLDQASIGYATEAAEYKQHHDAPTFKATLVGLKGHHQQ